jgi:cold shock CspA family protein
VTSSSSRSPRSSTEVLRAGRVTTFDAERGTGILADDEGGATYPFHCTAITDGSRLIETGCRVVFLIRPGQLGRAEAAEVMPR